MPPVATTIASKPASDKSTFNTSSLMNITSNDKDLFISTQKQPLVNKMQGANWIELADDYGKKDVLANSTALYMDLRYSSYKEMLKKEMNPYDFSTMDKFENILSAFKSISITGKQNEAEISIKFSQFDELDGFLKRLGID